MSQNKDSNVIQFPGRKRENDSTAGVSVERAAAQVEAASPSGGKFARFRNLAGAAFAVILASGAVNQFVFNPASGVVSLTQASGTNQASRGLASIDRGWARDSQWERQMAEKLASPVIREIASTRIGRPANKEEQLRWGILEEKYTIAYQDDSHQLRSVSLQDDTATPSYILDRDKFLKDFGPLFAEGFKRAKLKSVEKTQEKTVESYTIYSAEDRAEVEARFELDRHKRLISLKVERIQI